MEEKINIAAILKDKSQGTKLYDWLHNIDIELDTISTTDTETVVWCTNETNNNTTCHRGYSEFGTERGYPDGLQILFPSKEMRNWSKFAWKKGDVLISNDYGTEVIFYDWYDNTYTNFHCKHYLNSEDKNKILYYKESLCATARYSLEDRDAAQTYINTIEERLGGKLNRETLEIEKQPEKKKVIDLKLKWTPKPFDKIVAFEELGGEWVCDMFSHYSKNYEDKEIIVAIGGCTYFKALPFNEKTAKLIGTTKEWKE